jgi:hypothetical protein
MADVKFTLYHDLSTGNVINYGLQDGFQMILVYGTSTGAVTTNFTGTTANDMDLFIEWSGDSGANAVTIITTPMPASMALVKHLIHCHYNAVTTSWDVEFLPSGDTAFLVNSMVKSDAAIARSKTASATADYVLINDNAGVMSEEQYLNQVRGGLGQDVSGFTGVVKSNAGAFSASDIVNTDIDAAAAIDLSKLDSGAAGQIIVCDGAGVPTYTTMSGDATIDQNGVVTLAAGQIQSFDVTIASADILTMNASPIQLVGAQGGGLGIELVSCTGSITYNSVTYATQGDIVIKCATATTEQAYFTSARLLFGTITRTACAQFGFITGSGATSTTVVANQALIAQVNSAEPTAGNSTIRLQGLYRVIQVP